MWVERIWEEHSITLKRTQKGDRMQIRLIMVRSLESATLLYIIINVLCDLVGRYRDDGRLILRPGRKEKEPTSVGSRTQAK